MNRTIKYIALALTLCFCGLVIAQTQEELKKKSQSLLSEIKYANKLIAESREAQQFTEAELAILQKQIDLRAQLIRSMRKETQKLNADILDIEESIERKEAELVKLKSEYTKLVRLAYKHSHSDDEMLYIFAADDFYQAWMRMRHLKDLARYREKQGDEILDTKRLLSEQRVELEVQRKEKIALIEEQKVEQRALDKDRKTKKQSLNALRENEGSLREDIAQKEKLKADLDKQLQRLIAAEIERNRDKSKDGTYTLTPEETLESKYFSQNRGKLPWPVERGVITGKFGSYNHPVLPGIVINNNGIDISTAKGAMVRTCFEGEVSGIIDIPGNGMAVVVKHGGYRTVYSNIKEVLVSKGSTVSTKQSIGVLLPEGNGSIAHMEIWQVTSSGMEKLDPGSWLAR